jgi:hypothetical protein
MEIHQMDVRSEVLKVVKLDGAIFFNGELSSPWCTRETDSDSTWATRRSGRPCPQSEQVFSFNKMRISSRGSGTCYRTPCLPTWWTRPSSGPDRV